LPELLEGTEIALSGTQRGACGCLRAATALSIILDVSRQCHEDVMCLLGLLPDGLADQLMCAVRAVAHLHPPESATLAQTAALSTLRAKGLLAVANVVEQSDDASVLGGAVDVLEQVLAAAQADSGNPLLAISGAASALALGRVISGSILASHHAGTRVSAQHVVAAALCCRTSFGAYCAASFARNAISLVPFENCLKLLWQEPHESLYPIVTSLLEHATVPAVVNELTAFVVNLIEDHAEKPSPDACSVVQQICGRILSVAGESTEGRTRLIRTGVECGSQVILTSLSAGGCGCSPHVGELVHFIDSAARAGPFDDALTRRIGSAVGAAAVVRFETALPGESPVSLCHAAATLVRDSVHASTSAFNSCCMAYGASLIALGLHAGANPDIASNFFDYVQHLAKYFSTQATDFALAGCLLPLSVMIATDPSGTATAIHAACRLDSGADPRYTLKARQAVSAVLSLWLAVAPNADTRVQSYTLAAWHRWVEAALAGNESAQFVLADFGLDAQGQPSPALSRACVRFRVLRTLHPKRTAKDSVSTPANVLRDGEIVTFAEGMALGTIVLSAGSSFNVTRLASFASHEAFDNINLTRWASCPTGLPIPQKLLPGMTGGSGVVLVPYLSDTLATEMREQLPSLLGRLDQLRLDVLEPHRR